MLEVINKYSALIIPTILLLILTLSMIKRKPSYELFVEGAGEGAMVVVKIFPALLAIYVATSMLKASGFIEILAKFIEPFTKAIGMPTDILPLAILRPISGSGSIAIVNDLIATHGADSLISKIATTLSGATETTFYTIALYFGAVGIKKNSYSLFCALIADFTSIIASVIISNMIFG